MYKSEFLPVKRGIVKKQHRHGVISVISTVIMDEQKHYLPPAITQTLFINTK